MNDIFRYILENGVPVPEPDLLTWAAWFESHPEECIVAQEIFGEAMVSTVFLGLDYGSGGRVLLYETLVMGGPLNREGRRYSTLEEARIGHKDIAAWAALVHREST